MIITKEIWRKNWEKAKKSNENNPYFPDVGELREYCYSQLRKSILYMDMPCFFYYARLIDVLNIYIKKYGKKDD